MLVRTGHSRAAGDGTATAGGGAELSVREALGVGGAGDDGATARATDGSNRAIHRRADVEDAAAVGAGLGRYA